MTDFSIDEATLAANPWLLDQGILRKYSLTPSHSPFEELIHDLNAGELDIDAPYQRDHVWDRLRQLRLIHSITIGKPCGSMYRNRREYPHHDRIIDGKQRITAVASWLLGEIAAPSCWFPTHNGSTPLRAVDAPQFITFDQLAPAGQRVWKNLAVVNIYTTTFDGPDYLEREEELFKDVNFGGLAQGERDENPAPRPDVPALKVFTE